MDEEKDIDQATSGWLKKMTLDDPSENFSKQVMNSIFALNAKKSEDNFNYWWFLLLIPVLVAGGWYLSTLPEFMAKLTQFWTATTGYYNSLNSGFGEFFGSLKGISISPIVILIFLAVLSLLIIEDIFSKSRHNVKADA